MFNVNRLNGQIIIVSDVTIQAEWKCVASNDHGQSVTSCFLKLIIPKHYKKPKFLESLRAILSEEGAVNLECKVIGVPQPILKWYKDGVELKPGDIHRIISGQDGTCCLGTYTCEATNCMGTVSSSASLLGFEGILIIVIKDHLSDRMKCLHVTVSYIETCKRYNLYVGLSRYSRRFKEICFKEIYCI